MPLWSRKQTKSGSSAERSDRELIIDTYALLDKLQRKLRTEQYIELSRAQRGQIMGNIKQGISAKQMDVYFRRDLKMIDNSRDRCSAYLQDHKRWMLATFDALSENEQSEYATEFLRVSADLYTAATGDPDTAGIDGAKARLIFYFYLSDLESLYEERKIDDAMLLLGMTALYDACRVHFLAYEGVPEKVEQWLVDRSDQEPAREYLNEVAKHQESHLPETDTTAD